MEDTNLKKLLENAALKVETSAYKLHIELYNFEKQLVFKYFDDEDIPEITVNEDGKIVAKWSKLELPEDDLIYHMCNDGYIGPDDFLCKT